MPKCDFNKVAKELYLIQTSAFVLSCKFGTYFQNTFFWYHLWMAVSASYEESYYGDSDDEGI